MGSYKYHNNKQIKEMLWRARKVQGHCTWWILIGSLYFYHNLQLRNIMTWMDWQIYSSEQCWLTSVWVSQVPGHIDSGPSLQTHQALSLWHATGSSSSIHYNGWWSYIIEDMQYQVKVKISNLIPYCLLSLDIHLKLSKKCFYLA